MPALNGYGTLTEESSSGAGDGVDTAAETFVTAGLAKVLKINNICDNDHLADCGFASEITTLKGSRIDLPKTLKDLNPGLLTGTSEFSYSMLDTKAAAFETANGESVLAFYNPNCAMDFNGGAEGGFQYWFIQPNMCANFVYDLNGNKGPNTVGKDIGIITAMYPADTVVVAPYPYVREASSGISQYDAAKACTEQDPEYRIPNIEELIALYVNKNLYDFTNAYGAYWSSTLTSSTYAMAMANVSGRKISYSRSLTAVGVHCVKR